MTVLRVPSQFWSSLPSSLFAGSLLIAGLLLSPGQAQAFGSDDELEGHVDDEVFYQDDDDESKKKKSDDDSKKKKKKKKKSDDDDDDDDDKSKKKKKKKKKSDDDEESEEGEDESLPKLIPEPEDEDAPPLPKPREGEVHACQLIDAPPSPGLWGLALGGLLLLRRPRSNAKK